MAVLWYHRVESFPAATPPTTVSTSHAAITGQRELSHGIAVQIATECMALGQLAEWISFERKCCPFLEFRIDIAPKSGPVWLSLTGLAIVGTGVFLTYGVRDGARIFAIPCGACLGLFGVFGWIGHPLNLFHLLGAFLGVLFVGLLAGNVITDFYVGHAKYAFVLFIAIVDEELIVQRLAIHRLVDPKPTPKKWEVIHCRSRVDDGKVL